MVFDKNLVFVFDVLGIFLVVFMFCLMMDVIFEGYFFVSVFFYVECEFCRLGIFNILSKVFMFGVILLGDIFVFEVC